MRILNVMMMLSTGAIAALLAVPTMGQSETVTERLTKLYAGPDEYYFYEDDRKQVINYKEERLVRVCAGDSRHLVPLKVTFDGKTASLDSNDCIRVEAKNVYLEPTKPLEENWVIEANVETLS